MKHEDAQGLPADEGRLEAPVKPLCAHCGFALPASGTGVRHYGTHTAHQENECLRLMHAEIARLTVRLERLQAENMRLHADVERLTVLAEDYRRWWETECRAVEAMISGGRYPDGTPAW